MFLRDIFTNPFHLVAPDPAWLTAQVLTVARSAYDHRILPWGRVAPIRLAVLADALEDAGCDDVGVFVTGPLGAIGGGVAGGFAAKPRSGRGGA